tara:strand:- start:6 stop:623 length:618 start_codon:yes stop_codon:yes gene_type:complete
MSIVKLNNRGVRSVTTFGSATGGSMTFIKKLTASSSATLSFVDGSSDVVLDSTYKEYIFKFIDIHPATDNSSFTFQASTDGGSNYNTTVTSSSFRAYHDEPDGTSGLSYDTSRDQAQGTAFENIIGDIGNDNDQTGIGTLHLFNPSDTTFVKHFLSNSNKVQFNDYQDQQFNAGYFNTTSAINAIQFKMSSGNIDAGDICLYGIN